VTVPASWRLDHGTTLSVDGEILSMYSQSW